MERALGEKLLLPQRRNQSENLKVSSCLRRAAMSAKDSRLMAVSTSMATLGSDSQDCLCQLQFTSK